MLNSLFRITFCCLAILPLASTAQTAPAYKIDLEIKPYQNQWVFLAYHYGKLKGLADSAFLGPDSRGVFTGTEPLKPGIYIVASPSKTILFEMLIDKDQQFSAKTDTLNLGSGVLFEGSSDNTDFTAYTKYVNERAGDMEAARKVLNDSASGEAQKESASKLMTTRSVELDSYRKDYIEQNPESMLAVIFKAMIDHPAPEALQQPKTSEDSLALYRYGKDHYWDDIDLMDGRLVRTPILENKLSTYINNWVVPDADSIIAEFNWMIALGRNDPEMSRFLISYFVDNYMYPKIMGQDKVFLHVYNRYIADDNPQTNWLNENQKKVIRERAYMVMANQVGTTAWDMTMEDPAGKVKKLYDVKGDYTVVVFWDVHCGKCREEMPKMDSLYSSFWKQKNVKVYAVMVNEDNIKDWRPYINDHGKDWVHVHEPKAFREKVEKEGKPSFRQLYDMRATPTLYLLDKDKKIIAKNIGLTDLHELLKRKTQS